MVEVVWYGGGSMVELWYLTNSITTIVEKLKGKKPRIWTMGGLHQKKRKDEFIDVKSENQLSEFKHFEPSSKLTDWVITVQ